MDLTRRGIVVVGVDGSPEATEAARYAARAAVDRAHDLLVAHSHQLASAPPISADFITDMRLAGQEVLDQALRDLAAPSSLRVETLLSVASPVPMLRQLAEVAEMVVLGHHHVGLVERLLLGSIAAPVAAKSPCPVVIVSHASSPAGRNGGAVVVALDGETPGSAALDYAFAETELTRTHLLALHATPLDELPKDNAEEVVNIEEVLAGWKQDHPDMSVSTRLVPGEPEDVIVDYSHQAAVLVVGRPHSGHFGSWTRSVARAVMSRSACPLAIVPPRRSDVQLAAEVHRAGVPNYSC